MLDITRQEFLSIIFMHDAHFNPHFLISMLCPVINFLQTNVVFLHEYHDGFIEQHDATHLSLISSILNKLSPEINLTVPFFSKGCIKCYQLLTNFNRSALFSSQLGTQPLHLHLTEQNVPCPIIHVIVY